MFVPMPIKTNEPTKITASAMAPNRVQKVILSRSSIMLGSLLRVSWSRARLIVYQFPGSHVDRPGVPRSSVLPAEHERRPGSLCPASSRRSGVRGTGPLRGLPVLWLAKRRWRHLLLDDPESHDATGHEQYANAQREDRGEVTAGLRKRLALRGLDSLRRLDGLRALNSGLGSGSRRRNRSGRGLRRGSG